MFGYTALSARSNRSGNEHLRRTALVSEASQVLDAISRSQAVIAFDLNGTVLEANQNFLTAMGYAADEIIAGIIECLLTRFTRKAKPIVIYGQLSMRVISSLVGFYGSVKVGAKSGLKRLITQF